MDFPLLITATPLVRALARAESPLSVREIAERVNASSKVVRRQLDALLPTGAVVAAAVGRYELNTAGIADQINDQMHALEAVS